MGNDIKSQHKSRHQRANGARALRRSIQEITPENSHQQTQSPLFSTLPSEIRNLIFEYALCECQDETDPVDSQSRHFRPGHEYKTRIETALLQTCRLIYYEAQAIPLRSATHHLFAFTGTGSKIDWDHYIFHLTKQQGQNLYHLHDIMGMIGFARLSKYLKHTHLQWRKITWTIRTSLWGPLLAPPSAYLELDGSLRALRFPVSCQEVNIELETLENGATELRTAVEDFAAMCRKIKMRRRDDTYIPFDSAGSFEYTWTGFSPSPTQHGTYDELAHTGPPLTVTYHVIRLRWHSGVPTREYANYDNLNCLSSRLAKVVTRQSTESAAQSR
ncbi:uncharacterized protein BDR25DRAFT_7992 [Lindgomyces ingoldianus]|uniref:Uncharacterized protein n=1 Tax=Lindgomyces ingoldianus TaxID=673940 RepID=A0ACB6RG51_9PLEO|nr:uncharacterized protein BDR25DRAFT_7992 [Lindgomyces ingoldianus]KAF2478097.1 hypothetical protein BDR25DRAFT_7992 [Lindgomyces ingoldianus]